ncbi:MAG: HsdR family type I site-specific deoxyribonuclease, partial [Thermomicrobiales bacterium]
MSDVGQLERQTQKRVVQFFRETLGYDYLGNWEGRPNNANVEEALLRTWLSGRGVESKLIEKALRELSAARSLGGGKSLYQANEDVYGLLRYGAKVSPDVGEHKQTVKFIDWKHPERNHFAIAEEVTVEGHFGKRPDIVLYINGIAIGMLELKRSTVSVSEGIRQVISSQSKDFIRPFFATNQLVMAGNDIEGLRYGAIEAGERYWLSWKEAGEIANPLDRTLQQLCSKERLLEIVHDFIVFDKGVKKICRQNQYFGVKAAQLRVKAHEGGIIWHTQGSGKSLTMVWLAKWIWENMPDARVLIVTDRTELDEQIADDFTGVNEKIYRTRSGSDLIATLDDTAPWLMCSLVHKFGTGDADTASVDAYVKELEKNLPRDFRAKGNLYVFVDECHRTQSGKLHRAMKALLPEAMFIGFTGTPLLKADKQKSIETFGSY